MCCTNFLIPLAGPPPRPALCPRARAGDLGRPSSRQFFVLLITNQEENRDKGSASSPGELLAAPPYGPATASRDVVVQRDFSIWFIIGNRECGAVERAMCQFVQRWTTCCQLTENPIIELYHDERREKFLRDAAGLSRPRRCDGVILFSSAI